MSRSLGRSKSDPDDNTHSDCCEQAAAAAAAAYHLRGPSAGRPSEDVDGPLEVPKFRRHTLRFVAAKFWLLKEAFNFLRGAASGCGAGGSTCGM